MANRGEKLRKAYEFKLGKDIASKLSDEQIALISKYYNSLTKEEKSDIDSYFAMGKTNDLSDSKCIANQLIFISWFRKSRIHMWRF